MKDLLKAVFVRVFPLVLFADIVMTGAASSQALDAGSVECLSCHDPAMTSTPGASAVKICPVPACNHPVGGDYGASAAIKQDLKQPPLNPVIPLFDNRMGCGTCHVPYASSSHRDLSDMRKNTANPDPMLIMDNRVGQLCRGCHLMN